jgi:hypothetical protein
MDKKTTAIVATVVSVLLCGCPGIFALFLGVVFAGVSFIPGANIDMMGSREPRSALMFGLGGVCLGLVFILIAVVVSTVAWRRKR